MAKTTRPKINWSEASVAQQRAWIKNGLRRMSYRSPGRSAALKAARIERGIYECKACKKRHRTKEGKMDHVTPVVSVSGWDSWDGVIHRLDFFNGRNYQRLCTNCHVLKTQAENNQRKDIRRAEKKTKKENEECKKIRQAARPTTGASRPSKRGLGKSGFR